MKRLRRVAIAALLPALAQCSMPTSVLPPFETIPPTIKPASSTIHVSVCYNSLTTTADQVRAIAADSCGTESVPKPLERDLTLAHCPILQPLRATFTCQPSHEPQ